MAGETIAGRYALVQPLGGGAMGTVWLARDRELDRDIALKVLARDADRARFEREARAVAGLAHPNVCLLYDYGESADGPYMVLEYLPGGTLEDRLAAGRPLADAETARIAHDVASGLAHAHEHGVVHRDLKPANVLFDAEDRAKIADFGIARIAGGRQLTEPGSVLGTAAYLSPEQAAGERATAASDVYSFGAILYRMLTGRTPFVSRSAMELVRMHQEDAPPPVARLRSAAPPALAALAMAALSKDPAARPADGDALVRTLESADATTMHGLPSAFEAPPTLVLPRVRQPRKGPSRHGASALPLIAAGALLLAAAGVAAAVLLTRDGGTAAGSTSAPALPTVQANATSGGAAPPPATTASAPASSTTTTPTRSGTVPATSTAPATGTATVSAPPPTSPTTAAATTSTAPPTTTAAEPTTSTTTTATASTTTAATTATTVSTTAPTTTAP